MTVPTSAPPPGGVDDHDRTTRVRRVLEGVIGVAATEGNRIEALVNGDRIFSAMLEAIGAARHTIDFLTFIYWNGEIATRFAKELSAPRKPEYEFACSSTAGARTRWTGA